MSDASAELQARADLFDLTTTPERLAQIARDYPQFASYIAGHPNVYPELKQWAQEFVATQQTPPPTPSFTPPAATDTAWKPEPLPDPYLAQVTPGYSAGAYPYANAPVMMAPPTNTMAVLSLVFAFVFAPLGIVFGHIANGQIRRTGEAGSGLATAGLIIGYVFTAFWVLYILMMILIFSAAARY